MKEVLHPDTFLFVLVDVLQRCISLCRSDRDVFLSVVQTEMYFFLSFRRINALKQPSFIEFLFLHSEIVSGMSIIVKLFLWSYQYRSFLCFAISHGRLVSDVFLFFHHYLSFAFNVEYVFYVTFFVDYAPDSHLIHSPKTEKETLYI